MKINCLIVFSLLVLLSNIFLINSQTYTNTTLESSNTNFTHLNLSTTSPYDKLVLYMPFDVNHSASDNNKTYDYSNNSNDGIVNGAEFNSSGKYGGAYSFDGTSDYISINDPDSLKFYNNDFSFSFWFKREGSWVNHRGLIVKGADTTLGGVGCSAGEEGIYFRSQFTENYTWYVLCDGQNKTSLAGDYGVYTGDWVHVVFGKNSTSAYVYVDGTLKDVTSASTLINLNNTGNLVIARQVSGGGVLGQGVIDELMIFNQSLTSSQIQDIYNNQSSRFVNNGTINHTITTTGNKINVTLDSCQKNLNTNISMKINGGSETFFNGGCSITNYSFTGGTNNIEFKLYSNSSDGVSAFYSPLHLGNFTYQNYTVQTDSNPPVITIISPLNQVYRTSIINFNISVTDDTAISVCLLNISNGNITLDDNDPYFNYTNSSIPDGNYVVTFYCNDTLGNIGTNTQSFTINTVIQTIFKLIPRRNIVPQVNITT